MDEREPYGKTPVIQRRKIAIIEKARALIVGKGIANTTMQEIAIAANIGRKTLYRYFPNIEAIAHAIMISLSQSPQSFSNTYMAIGANGLEKIRHACLSYSDYCAANPDLLLFYYEYDYHYRQPRNPEVHQAWAQRPNLFVEILKEGIADGSLTILPEHVHPIGVTIPNTIQASAQRLISREKVYQLEYNYSLQDLHYVAELLVDGINDTGKKK